MAQESKTKTLTPDISVMSLCSDVERLCDGGYWIELGNAAEIESTDSKFCHRQESVQAEGSTR